MFIVGIWQNQLNFLGHIQTNGPTTVDTFPQMFQII